jgi:hypothetical protein
VFRAKSILICGEGAIAGAIAARLGRAGHAARLIAPDDLSPRLLNRAEALILADPPDPRAAVSLALALCAARPPSGSPLRVILAHRGDLPPGLPDPDGSPARVESFALEAQAARALLAAHPPHAGFDPLFGQIPHLLIAGSSPPALALLGQAMRLALYAVGRPVFTLAADPFDAWRTRVLAAYPQAGQCCVLHFTALDEPSLAGLPPVTGAWVCVDPPQAGLDTAVDLASRLMGGQGVTPLIQLEVGDATPAGEVGDWDGQIVPVSWLDAACGPHGLLSGGSTGWPSDP